MKKKIILLFILFIAFLIQCKKKENAAEEIIPQQPIPTDYTKPCQLSSFFSGIETTRFTYIKNSKGKMIEKTASYYTAVSPSSVKITFEYNTQGQLIKTSHHILLPSPAEGGYETYEYDLQGRIIKKIILTSPNSFVATQEWEYNKDNRVEKIKQKVDNIDAPIYINLVYDTDGDLIHADWCDVGNNQCITVESYEYDKTKPFCKIPETFIIQPLIDIPYGTHFLKKKNIHNSQGTITSSIHFQIEEALPNGYPTLLSAYPEGSPNQKTTYTYDYDCE